MPGAIVLAVLLAGCQSGGPVVTGNDGGILTITQPKGVPAHRAKDLAAQTCGTHASALSKQCADPSCTQETLTFWCR